MIMRETSWEYVIRENRIEIEPFYNNKEVQKDGGKSFCEYLFLYCFHMYNVYV